MIWVFEKKLSEKGFHLDVEETRKFPEGIISMINHEGRRLYFKLGEKVKEGTILHPLSKQELRTVGIEESANSEIEKLIGIQIEE